MKRKLFLFSILIFILDTNSSLLAQNSTSADTLVLTIQDAEKLFLENNFDLLAAKYQVNEADAAMIQAKLWDNPTLTIDQGAYNKSTNKWFDLSDNGQTAVSLQQLIHLAGQRSKRINIEKINTQIAQFQFYNLMRSLHYELRTSFYSLYFLQQSLAVYDRELTALKTLVDAYSTEYQKGNIPFKELARLQSLQFGLQNEKIELLKNVSDNQSSLTLLIGDTLSRAIKPSMNGSTYDGFSVSNLKYTELIDSGLVNRFDLKMADAQIQAEETNLSLQKSLRIPDMTIGANYDKNGSYIHNYNSVSLSFDLPFWNHNQGNIKLAKNRIDEVKSLRNKSELIVKTDISKAFTALLETDKLYHSSIQKFDDNYDKLLDGILLAYQNHTINLLEFIDYYETYKNSKNEFYHLQINRLSSIEALNEATGTTILK